MKNEMKNKSESVPEKKSAYLSAALFITVLVSFSVAFTALPKDRISAVENRLLADLPEFDWNKLLAGTYTDSLNLFVSDHFPFRGLMLDLSFKTKQLSGIRSGDVAIYRNLAANDSLQSDSLGLNDSISDSLSGEDDLMANGLFIYQGQAMQLFSGSQGSANYYASILNQYQQQLKGTVTIYSLIIPSPSEFYLPGEYRKLSSPEKPNIDRINNALNPEIKVVDAYSAFREHQNEYLFFRTDHHATVLGGYYSYVAFCKTAGLTPVPLSSMTKKTKYHFLGSLYGKTQDPRLGNTPDTVDYYLIPGNYKTTIYLKENQKKPIKSQLLVEANSGYMVFLGGDKPLLVVETDNNNGRRALVVKSSMGNTFVPFLVPHFERVYAVDYRYFNLGLLNFIVENKVTDLIFFNCTVLANARWHAQCILNIMYYRNIPIEISGSDSLSKPVSKDSLQIKTNDSINKADSVKNSNK
jgi:hypothetical protein